MSDVPRRGDSLDQVYGQIRQILSDARGRAWQAVNAAMVAAYWEVGRVIVEEEQHGAARAEYGRHLLEELSRRLSAEFGKGFDRTNLQQMRNFYMAYPIRDAVRHELTWTHCRLLLRVDNSQARSFYEAEAVNARWSTRELERQINSMLFERLALSRDREGVMALAQQGHEIHVPEDLVKDPYVLEFTGLRQAEHFRETDLEGALIAKLQQFLRELTIEGENPPIGIILCADKSEAVVRYTLPEGNSQIFASRYKLYLPTEEELIREIQSEQESFDEQRRLDEG